MRAIPTDLPDVLIIEPDVYRDPRGFFLETYHAAKYRSLGIPQVFVQDNQSQSVYGTVRGLHLQWPNPQGKLVRVLEGEIFDVAVDVRRGSPGFGRWVGLKITADSFRQIYVPPGFAHGFSVLSPVAQIEYKCTAPYDRDAEIGIAWNDPSLAIPWGVDSPILSARDATHRPLAAMLDRLPEYANTNL